MKYPIGMNRSSRIYVAGSSGMVGSAIVRRLEQGGYTVISTTRRSDIDLTDTTETRRYFGETKPEIVFVAAARVGGIQANNTMPVEFLLDNLRIQNNVIQSAVENGAEKLLFLGSSCIYPKLASQPITEDELLTGPLEPTNEAYAIAKIAGIKLCEAYARQYGKNCVSVMPTNLYGPNDNFDLRTSHVLPALVSKFHIAKVEGRPNVEVWGTGSPLREFMHVDDLADACVFLMERDIEAQVINVGSSKEISIRELANLVKRVVDYEGEIVFNTEMPDGTPRKLMDSRRIRALGWEPKIGLEEGIATTYHWALENQFTS